MEKNMVLMVLMVMIERVGDPNGLYLCRMNERRLKDVDYYEPFFSWLLWMKLV